MGLSVNEVAAVGEAGGPEDRLVLAPRTVGLAQEDLEAQPEAVVAALRTAETDAPITDNTPILQQDVAALASQLASISSAMPVEEDVAVAEVAAPPTPATDPVATVEVIPASVPGVVTSLRPLVRPASFTVPAAVETADTDEVAVTTASFPAGTNLVQLGAFPNPALAAAEWERLQARFGPLMGDYSRVIEVSNQSTATWYRLRASGFEDRAAARQLCAALQAEGADCIAVVTN